MFIKKDTRKIPEILTDESDTREYLKLSKRPAEFQGSAKLIFQEDNLHALLNLKSLNLYDNDLGTVQGIGLLSHSPINDISLGMNKLTSLPLEFGLLSSLTSVWLDDNLLDEFPVCLCQLQNLCTLRMTGNSISALPAAFAALENLEVLALDNNSLTDVPPCVLQLPKLRELWLRQNRITELGEEISALAELEVLSISSNQLQALPSNIATLCKLRKLYANGNRITAVPGAISALNEIEIINLANNQLKELPVEWLERWGQYIPKLGSLGREGSSMSPCSVVLLGNPLA